MARVSFDFDDTLLQTVPDGDQGLIEAGPNEPIIALMREHKAAGDTVLIVTSRCEKFEGVVTHGWTERMAIADFVVKHDLPADLIIFTNGEDKAPMLVALGVVKHFDDDADELALLPDSIEGVLVPMHPAWGSDTGTEA
jgi:hypothetical protein